MPQVVNNPEDIAMVREFFASLSRSERLRMYDFFKSRIGFDENSGQRLSARTCGNDGPKIDPQRRREASQVPSDRGTGSKNIDSKSLS